MSEFEAPLAKGEEWTDFGDFQGSESTVNTTHNDFSDANFADDSLSHSLEDLVNCFDEKITNCFRNYDAEVETSELVLIKTQEEIIADCPLWMSLTGNWGKILPIDWTKTHSRRLQLPSLNLMIPHGANNNRLSDFLADRNVDEDELAKDLDLHSLILNSLSHPQEPVLTAEEVLEEIDQIMQCPSEASTSVSTPSWTESSGSSIVSDDSKASLTGKLRALSTVQLNEVYIELERMIQLLSETLIQELATRDELDFEKEYKNSFISHLLTVQNKRRQVQTGAKKPKGVGDARFLTTVIPYTPGQGPPDLATLQVLIKILKAIEEDSPTVPTLLTDYILKVVCPN